MEIKEWFIGDDFIGAFDTDYDCSGILELWDYHDRAGSTEMRTGFGDGDAAKRRDKAIALPFGRGSYGSDPEKYQTDYNDVVYSCLELYREKFSTLKGLDFQQLFVNIQKTEPGEGYHSWHCETIGDGPHRNRVLATMMYLNTIPEGEGGETEFLYQHKRYNPIAGRVMIWPAGFTHMHRGNPPLKGTKYIITSWLEMPSH